MADSVQRRLAAILAADVAGYSRLMGEDEAGTRTRFNAHLTELIEPAIARQRGRIVKKTGDALLVEFASVVDAVKCAAEIQLGMAERNREEPANRQIVFRIGVNLGDVIVEGDDIHGEGVNVAARLETLCEPGAVYVSGTVHDHVEGKLAVTFDDLGEQTVKNITKPVQVYRVTIAGPEPSKSVADVPAPVTGFGRRPAIAVLPFENMSRDPEQEYFADGLTEDIITALSLCHSFPVIARQSSFIYKDRAVKVQDVARELGASYVLEGSVRKGDERLRVTAQLIDAETGHHVWAERFDQPIADVFVVQDEITERIAGIVAPELSKAALKRIAAKRVDNLDAWECYLRGLFAIYEDTKAGNDRGRELLQRAIDLDPSYSQAYTALSYLHNRAVHFDFTDDPEASVRTAVDAARRAIKLDDSDSVAHTNLARALFNSNQYEAAITAARKGVEINPFDAEAKVILGAKLIHAGRPEEGMSWLRQGIGLNPRDPRLHLWTTHVALCHLCLAQFREASDRAREAIVEAPSYKHARIVLAASLGFLGEKAQAKSSLNGIDLAPEELDAFVERRSNWGGAIREKIRDGLRKAGLLE